MFSSAKKPDKVDPLVEEDNYEYRPVQWKDFVTKPKYIPWYIVGIVILVGSVFLTIRHDQVVEAVRPTSEKIRELPGGFVIPVVILVVISFPPLFGHELIALLCGVVYGLWIGFAIVAAGTFIGEIGTWYAFQYAFRRRAVKLERTNLNYGALARFTRDGGFIVVLIIRFSIIPSHFSTAVFSTCNVKFWHFAVATFLTLPKQIILVYIGVLLVQENKSNKINTIVLAITFVITLIAGAWVYNKMRLTKKVLLEEQAARLDKKKRDVSGEFGQIREVEGRVEIRGAGRGWERQRSVGEEGFVRPPPPMKASWQEETLEMGDMGRPRAQVQEFI